MDNLNEITEFYVSADGKLKHYGQKNTNCYINKIGVDVFGKFIFSIAKYK